MAALVELAHDLVGRWRIHPARVLGHSDIAPSRKDDPGELFDWPRLARDGLCVATPSAPPLIPDAGSAWAALAGIGYPGRAQGVTFGEAVRAFQRRHRPGCCDGTLEDQTMGLLAAVAALCVNDPATT
jgi:N-acetylmuramoyl-L-alanine amidase